MSGLDLESVETVASTELYSPAAVYGIMGLTTLVWLGLIVLSVWLGLRLKGGEQGRRRLRDLAGEQQILVGLVALSLMCAQALGAADAYVQINEVYTSSSEYFQYISWARLLGISHAHIFGYTVLYGLLSWFLSMTEASSFTRVTCTAVMMWTALLDVVCWWGVKIFGEAFHLLMLFSGALLGFASLFCIFFIVQAIFAGPAQARD